MKVTGTIIETGPDGRKTEYVIESVGDLLSTAKLLTFLRESYERFELVGEFIDTQLEITGDPKHYILGEKVAQAFDQWKLDVKRVVTESSGKNKLYKHLRYSKGVYVVKPGNMTVFRGVRFATVVKNAESDDDLI